VDEFEESKAVNLGHAYIRYQYIGTVFFYGLHRFLTVA
jgi:hypothetical protein